jgi:hypothetical protein
MKSPLSLNQLVEGSSPPGVTKIENPTMKVGFSILKSQPLVITVHLQYTWQEKE